MPEEDLNVGLTSFIRGVPQIVPESWCQECRICCRFPEQEGVQLPTWSAREAGWIPSQAGGRGWLKAESGGPSLIPQLQRCAADLHCPAFSHEGNRCTIHPLRPLDCRIYPFALARTAGGSQTLLAMDMKCPYVQAHGSDPEMAAYAQRLAEYLDSPAGLAYVEENPRVVGRFWPEFVSAAPLPRLGAQTAGAGRPLHPALAPLTEREFPLLEEAVRKGGHCFSVYAPAALLGWRDLARYGWTEVNGSFCLVAEEGGGYYMPLPPLGDRPDAEAFRRAWDLLTELNGGSGVSRIEGIEPWEVSRWAEAGFSWRIAEEEYFYRTEELVNLRGDRYRSQRWAANRCLREARPHLRPFREQDLVPCLQLYTQWAIRQQARHSEDGRFRSWIRDGLFFQRRLMMDCGKFQLAGMVAESGGSIRGYTFGAPVSPLVFCVLAEITDRTVPGLSALLSREFCRIFRRHPWMNAMGDGGFEGLRRAKLSYRPAARFGPVVVDRRDSS